MAQALTAKFTKTKTICTTRLKFIVNRRSVCLRHFGPHFWNILLWHWPLNLENWDSSWPDNTKYLGKFWLKSFQWFRSHQVHKIFMAITGWPWPLTQWPSQCHRCHVDLLMINCDQFHQNISIFSGDIKVTGKN